MKSAKTIVLSLIFAFPILQAFSQTIHDFDGEGVMYGIGSDGNKVGIGSSTPFASMGINASYLQVQGNNSGWLMAGNSSKYSYFVSAPWGSAIGFQSDSFLKFESGGDIMFVHSYLNGNANGGVSINTNNLPSGYYLAVGGKIITEGVHVEMVSNWPDFVFDKGYELPSLKDVENHIKEYGHLENIPSSEEVISQGYSLEELDVKLLQKLEELTLYTIQQEHKIESMQAEIQLLKKSLEILTNEN